MKHIQSYNAQEFTSGCCGDALVVTAAGPGTMTKMKQARVCLSISNQ